MNDKPKQLTTMKMTNISQAVLAAALMLTGCTTPPIASRVAENQQIYSRLSASEKLDIQGGKVGRGMDKAGVYLAWGAPDKKAATTWNNTRYETWCYNGYLSTQAPTRTVYDFGGHNRGDAFNERFFIDDTPGNYVCYKTREADFINGSLAGWAVTR